MKCAICGNGELLPGATTATFNRGTTTVVIKAVPANVCNECGEAYFDESISERLLQIVDAAARAGVEVEVRQFVAA